MKRWRIMVVVLASVSFASVFPFHYFSPRLSRLSAEYGPQLHTAAYGVLGFASCWAFWPLVGEEPTWRPQYVPKPLGVRFLRLVFFSIGVVLVLAGAGMLIEAVQEVLPTNRSWSTEDIRANILGALYGTAAWLVTRVLPLRR